METEKLSIYLSIYLSMRERARESERGRDLGSPLVLLVLAVVMFFVLWPRWPILCPSLVLLLSSLWASTGFARWFAKY